MMTRAVSVQDRVANLRAAQLAWSETALDRRLDVIRELRRLIAETAPSFVDRAVPALQKSRADFVAAEIVPLAEACRFLELRAEALLKPRALGRDHRPLWLSGTEVTLRREPWGLVLIIGPSNYPLLLPGVQALQALVAGNAVLIKPGTNGEMPIRWLIDLLEEAGLPPNLIAATSESVDDARAALRDNVDKVVLTGSAETGRVVLGRLAERGIPAVVELSGNDPVIVLPDADLDMTAKAIAYGLRLNGSATCIAPRRIFAIGPVYEALRDRLLAAVKDIPAVDIPAAIHAKLGGLLIKAGETGAVLHGALPPEGRPMKPIIIENVGVESSIARADIFAPVVMLFRAEDTPDAVAKANASPYALGASIFGSEQLAMEIAPRIDAGSVCINDLIVPTADPRVPFAGRKHSGFGATRGAEGLLEMTQIKAVHLRKGRFRPHFDVPGERDHQFLLSYLAAAHGRRWTTRVGAGMKAVRHMVARGIGNARRRP